MENGRASRLSNCTFFLLGGRLRTLRCCACCFAWQRYPLLGLGGLLVLLEDLFGPAFLYGLAKPGQNDAVVSYAGSSY